MFPSENELKERYASYSNYRLLGIVHCREEYTPQAIEIAKAELAGRKISTRDVDNFLDREEARRIAGESLATLPLSMWEKALFFFIWFAPWFLRGAFQLNYNEDGLTLKNQQSKVFALAGFISLLLDGFITVYFDMHNVFSLAILPLLFLIFQWTEKNYSSDNTMY